MLSLWIIKFLNPVILSKDSKGLSSNKNQFKKFESKNEGQNYNSEIKNKINSKLNLIGQVHNSYYNEVMAAELNNLSRENSELKFCLEKLNIPKVGGN